MLCGLALLGLQFFTDVFVSADGSVRRVSIKLLLLAGGAVVVGGGLVVTGFMGEACSACRVALTEREGHYDPGWWPQVRAAFERLRAGDPTALASLVPHPFAAPPAEGMEVASVGVEGCERCGQLARVSIARKRLKGDDAEAIEEAEPVVVTGPVAQHILGAMPRQG